MMKIQAKELDDQLTPHVEGRLAGAFVAGRSLLELMHKNRVTFLRAGLATQDILEQVMETPECKH